MRDQQPPVKGQSNKKIIMPNGKGEGLRIKPGMGGKRIIKETPPFSWAVHGREKKFLLPPPLRQLKKKEE